MAKKKKEKEGQAEFSRYSDTVADKTTRAVVLALEEAQAHKRFRTHVFGQIDGYQHWIEARRDMLNGSWSLVRFQRMGRSGPDILTGQDIVAGDLCFFDALHYCASYELLKKDLILEVPGDDPADVPEGVYYKVAAEAADVPLDESGLPHPAAWGYILTTGDFSKTAQDVARRTENKQINVQKEGADQSTALLPALPTTNASEQKIARQRDIKAIRDESQRLSQESEISLSFVNAAQVKISHLRRKAEKAAVVNKMIQKSVEAEFGDVMKKDKTGMGLSIFGVIGATTLSVFAAATGVWPVVLMGSMIGGLGGVAFRDEIKKVKAKTQFGHSHRGLRSANMMSEASTQAEKLLQDFETAAQSVFLLEYAALLRSKGKKRRGQKVIEELIKLTEMNDQDAQKLKQSFKSDQFPAPGSFAGRLDAAYQKLEEEVEKEILRIQENLHRRTLPLRTDAPRQLPPPR